MDDKKGIKKRKEKNINYGTSGRNIMMILPNCVIKKRPTKHVKQCVKPSTSLKARLPRT